MMRRTALRLAGIASVGLAIGLASSPAWADPPPVVADVPTVQDLANAQTAARADGLPDRLTNLRFPDAPPPEQDSAPFLSTQTIPVYELTAEFVRGESGTAASLAYLALPARTGEGAPVTVCMAREGESWAVDSIASGDREKAMADMVPAGAWLLHEAQVDTWYAISPGHVVVLDGTGLDLAPGVTYSLDAYQILVHDRYADKQVGSEYYNDGMVGGYGPQADGPGEFASVAGAPSGTARSGSASTLLATLVALAVIGASAWAVRRRLGRRAR
jgi:hypothetical protein